MTNERLNAAVEGLLSDRRLLRRFRRNPERALARFELTAEEVVAVRRGDAAELLRLGLDPRYVWPRAHTFTGWSWLLQNAKRLSPAVVLAAVLLPAAPAAARGRRGRSRSVVGRVSRYFAHRGVEAAFARRIARSGEAGALRSRAARGARTSRYLARAGRVARQRGVQPPPGVDSA